MIRNIWRGDYLHQPLNRGSVISPVDSSFWTEIDSGINQLIRAYNRVGAGCTYPYPSNKILTKPTFQKMRDAMPLSSWSDINGLFNIEEYRRNLYVRDLVIAVLPSRDPYTQVYHDIPSYYAADKAEWDSYAVKPTSFVSGATLLVFYYNDYPFPTGYPLPLNTVATQFNLSTDLYSLITAYGRNYDRVWLQVWDSADEYWGIPDSASLKNKINNLANNLYVYYDTYSLNDCKSTGRYWAKDPNAQSVGYWGFDNTFAYKIINGPFQAMRWLQWCYNDTLGVNRW